MCQLIAGKTYQEKPFAPHEILTEHALLSICHPKEACLSRVPRPQVAPDWCFIRWTYGYGFRKTRRKTQRQSRQQASVVKPSFSTSGPTFGPKPSFGSDPKARKGSASSSGYQPNPLKVGGPAPSKLTPEVLLTRRNLLIGAAAVGGIAAIGGGVSLASSALEGNSTEQISYISVPENTVEQQADYTLIENYSDYVQLTGSFSLPYGTLVWADNDTVAACLNPTEQASPLNTVSLLYLSSGNTATVLDAAQGSEEGFEILDARCSENGLVWTESNPYQSRWRVYTAPSLMEVPPISSR